SVKVADLSRTVYRLPVPDRVWEAAPEYFRYLGLLEAVEQVDVTGADMVVSTQPPSFAVDHPRHLSVFYHHLRVYYDLEAVYSAAGLVVDRRAHEAARDHVRRIDQPRLDRVTRFLAPPVTARRLDHVNGIHRVEVFHAGVDGGPAPDGGSVRAPGPVVCVSRSEFSKRTELFVHAMKYLAPVPATLIGGGGRLPWVRHVDERLSLPGTDLDAVDATERGATPDAPSAGCGTAGPRRRTWSFPAGSTPWPSNRPTGRPRAR
ncbi:MAG: hypothetical protein WKF43_04530, partial [Acidimicrobiales bacterium]